MAVHRADQRGGQGRTGRDLSRLGDIASTGNLPSVPHLLPIGFGTMGQRRSWRQASDFGRSSSRNGGRHHPGMVGESPKTEPRLMRRPGLLMSRGGLGAGGSATVVQIIGSPNHHCQIKSWLSKGHDNSTAGCLSRIP